MLALVIFAASVAAVPPVPDATPMEGETLFVLESGGSIRGRWLPPSCNDTGGRTGNPRCSWACRRMRTACRSWASLSWASPIKTNPKS